MPATQPNRQRVEDTVEALFRYNKSPFITDFLKQQRPKIATGTPKPILRDLFSNVLLDTYRGKQNYHLVLPEVVRYLDHLQETGCQHVFLFRLPPEERDELLAALRDPEEVRRRLGAHVGLFNAERVDCSGTEGPELAAVRHDPEKELFLEWVETRIWMELVDKEVDEETGEERVVRAPHHERTVNYFRFDLATGDAELRIQKLHSDARAQRLEIRETYRRLVADTLGLELPDPIVLAPAIRLALLEGEVEALSLGAVLPGGGKWWGGKGDRCPVEFRRLPAVIALKFACKQAEGGLVHVLLDGQIDEVQIQHPCIPEGHARILQRIREWHRRAIEEPEAEAEAPSPERRRCGESSEPPEDERVFARLRRLLQEASDLRQKSEEKEERLRIDVSVIEYDASHLESRRDSPRAPSSPYSIEQLLRHVEEIAESDKKVHDAEVERLGRDERWLFRQSFGAGVLALLLLAVGAYLVFFTDGNLTVGVLGEILGLTSGTGTAILRFNGRTLEKRRKEIESGWRERLDLRQWIHITLAIEDPDRRGEEMARVVGELRERVRRLDQREESEPFAVPLNSAAESK